MKLVNTVSIQELTEMSQKMFDPIVKAVVDVKRGALVIDAALHADQELFMLNNGSAQEDLWGFNFWPHKFGTDGFVEFDSMINMRPFQNNRSRGVDNPEIRAQILEIVKKTVTA